MGERCHNGYGKGSGDDLKQRGNIGRKTMRKEKARAAIGESAHKSSAVFCADQHPSMPKSSFGVMLKCV